MPPFSPRTFICSSFSKHSDHPRYVRSALHGYTRMIVPTSPHPAEECKTKCKHIITLGSSVCLPEERADRAMASATRSPPPAPPISASKCFNERNWYPPLREFFHHRCFNLSMLRIHRSLSPSLSDVTSATNVHSQRQVRVQHLDWSAEGRHRGSAAASDEHSPKASERARCPLAT